MIGATRKPHVEPARGETERNCHWTVNMHAVRVQSFMVTAWVFSFTATIPRGWGRVLLNLHLRWNAQSNLKAAW